MKLKILIFIFYLSLLLSIRVNSQNLFEYPFNSENMHFVNVPIPIGNIHPASNFNNINKAFVVESYATNSISGILGSDIHPGAGNVDNVFYGGNTPTADGHGAAAVPIYFNQEFNQNDFPIYLEVDFYSDLNIPAYNEHYFFIIPEDYQYFGSPTYYYNSNSLPPEGVNVGGRPFQSWVADNRSASQAGSFVVNETHNLGLNGEWYNFKAVFDLFNNELIVREVMINDQFVFDEFINLGFKPWVNNFRIGLAADDLANDFIIKTKYNSLIADFSISDTLICVNDCINFFNQSSTEIFNPNNSYFWNFEGATEVSSSLENPNNICFPFPGIFNISLIVRNDFEIDTIVKTVVVNPIPEIELGENVDLCLENELTLNAEFQGVTFLWSDGSTDSSLKVDSGGLYWVQLSTDNCTYRDSIEINIIAPPNINLGNDTIILCQDETIILDATDAFVSSYLWQDGSSESTIEVSESKLYSVIVEHECGTYDFSVLVQIKPPFTISDLGLDKTICEGDTILLDAKVEQDVQYIWQDGSFSPVYYVTSPGVYQVIVRDNCLEFTDAITITNEECCEVYVPNIFTPNDDGINDGFKIFKSYIGCNSISSFSLEIYDRWGNIVHSSNNIDKVWNGTLNFKKVEKGVYVYLLEYIDGVNQIVLKGDVTIIY